MQWAHPPGNSWMTLILPYVERMDIYQNLTLSSTRRSAGGNTPGNQYVRGPVHRCVPVPFGLRYPGKPNWSTTFSGNVPLAKTSYKGCAGSNWAFGSGTPNMPTMPELAFHTCQPRCGPIRRRSNVRRHQRHHYRRLGQRRRHLVPRRHDGGRIPARLTAPVGTTIAAIRDGTSNTFAVGETMPYQCNWSAWYWFERHHGDLRHSAEFSNDAGGRTTCQQSLPVQLGLHESSPQRRQLQHVRWQRPLHQRYDQLPNLPGISYLRRR